MLEARFVNMHPIMQHMFLALNDMINDEKKKFVLKALYKELRDVANEAKLNGMSLAVNHALWFGEIPLV